MQSFVENFGIISVQTRLRAKCPKIGPFSHSGGSQPNFPIPLSGRQLSLKTPTGLNVALRAELVNEGFKS